MNLQQFYALSLQGIDVHGAVHRLYDSEAVYSSFLQAFLEDHTMAELNEAVEDQAWDEAFTSAHAIKGMAGNMGFIPLMHSVGRLVVLIRAGKNAEIGESMEQVNGCYRNTLDSIHQYFNLADEEAKENEA